MFGFEIPAWAIGVGDRKSTRLNSSHSQISYAVFCLKKKKFESYFTSSDFEHERVSYCRSLLNAASDLWSPYRTVDCHSLDQTQAYKHPYRCRRRPK